MSGMLENTSGKLPIMFISARRHQRGHVQTFMLAMSNAVQDAMHSPDYFQVVMLLQCGQALLLDWTGPSILA